MEKTPEFSNFNGEVSPRQAKTTDESLLVPDGESKNRLDEESNKCRRNLKDETCSDDANVVDKLELDKMEFERVLDDYRRKCEKEDYDRILSNHILEEEKMYSKNLPPDEEIRAPTTDPKDSDWYSLKECCQELLYPSTSFDILNFVFDGN